MSYVKHDIFCRLDYKFLFRLLSIYVEAATTVFEPALAKCGLM